MKAITCYLSSAHIQWTNSAFHTVLLPSLNWHSSETHASWAPPNAIQKERRSKHPTELIAWLLTVSNTFNSLFKVLFTFPSWYLCSIDLPDIFSFGRTLAPIKTALPSSPTLRKPFVRGGLQAKDRAITCRCITFQWMKTSATLWTNFQTLHLTPWQGCDYKIELFPIHSQLLRKSGLVSFPPLSYMLKSRGLPCLAWLVNVDQKSTRPYYLGKLVNNPILK